MNRCGECQNFGYSVDSRTGEREFGCPYATDIEENDMACDKFQKQEEKRKQ